MAAPQIGTVTIPALVISLNNCLFKNGSNGAYGEEVIGKILPVPCRDIIYENTDRWAIPVKDAGIFTGLDFEYKSGDYLNQPTYDSFSVFIIHDTKSNFKWVIYGSRQDLITSCATCCDGTPVPMNGISPAVGIRISPCQIVDITDGNGNPYMLFGIPTLDAGQKYYPYGAYNNTAFPAASVSGYADVPSLLSFLNANWTPYVWTASIDGLTLIATGGALNDTLCVSVIEILPSP